MYIIGCYTPWWPLSLIPHELNAQWGVSHPAHLSTIQIIMWLKPHITRLSEGSNSSVSVPVSNVRFVRWGHWRFSHIWTTLQSSCLHKQLLTYIHSAPANLLRSLGFQLTQSGERRNVLERRRGEGCHAEHRPSHTCWGRQAKIVYGRVTPSSNKLPISGLRMILVWINL